MPRTQKRWLADQGMPDGQPFMWLSAGDVYSGTGATTGYTASGNFQLSLPTAAQAYVIAKSLNSLLFRTGMQDDLQEFFGSAQTQFSATQSGGKAGGMASPPAAFSTPAGVSGPPPFTGISEFTPVTAARPKGIQINSVTCVYEVGAVDASVNSIALYGTSFVNGVAPSVSTILAATNLTKTHAATPYVTTVSLSTPAYLTGQNTEYSLEWKLTPGASTGTALIWGVFLGVTYNFQ